ncbi:lysophospholipid acyltransferase family protein [Enteractinococcus coprophilus]|uniref:1-acyl-sn-glycerol-3-phosphate acyltransferase n=1 Tax=Enteractinococcus coprophilus TaxID=1027633 RepID=A0A543AJ62_9MICC|nr:lysophospholipid acyltransferase family protein [Enteractinococcus coprophilus]TQL72624.1 1-acyl-sn-glycerol-3-phosphate acyltransferase [Enteractinococcus coprophilus]
MAIGETGLVRTTVRTLLRVGARPETTGFEHVPTTGGFIVASNHLSFLDSVIIQALLPRQVRFFAKADYWTQPGLKGKIMSGFFDAVGSIPVERGDQSASVNALNQLVDFIEAGDGVGIYPEGTRSRDGRLYRGRTGVGWLALTTGVPVIPVGLIGTDKLQPPGRNIILPRKFQLRVGEPIQVEKLGPKHGLPIRRQTTDKIMAAIADLTQQERVATYNKRPDETAS